MEERDARPGFGLEREKSQFMAIGVAPLALGLTFGFVMLAALMARQQRRTT